jgi:hypothetical protein
VVSHRGEPEGDPERGDAGSGARRRPASKPVVEARRGRAARSPGRPSLTRRAWTKVRAATGLAVLVVASGVGLAAVIGLAVLAVAYALRQAVGG